MSNIKSDFENVNNLEQKLDAIIAWLTGQKAQEPFSLRIRHPNFIADAVIIATATSRRHAQGLARGLLALLHESGNDFSHMEGFEAAQWILLDCNDLLVHIFQKDTRDLYRLEELFQHANETLKENRP